MAPATGLEPVTYWLTANRSTAELRGNTRLSIHTNRSDVKHLSFIIFFSNKLINRGY